MIVSKSFQKISIPTIATITEKAKTLAPAYEKKNGQPFVYFQRGEVDYPSPPCMAEAFQEAFQKGQTKYPKPGGDPALKTAILQDLFCRPNNVENLPLNNVVITNGGQQGLQLFFNMFRGGTCGVFEPCWSALYECVFPYTETKYIPVQMHCGFGKWMIDYENLEKILPRCDTFYLNNPNNPTGKVFEAEDIDKIAAMCRFYGVLMVYDDAYKDIVFRGKYYNPLSNPENTNVIVVSTFSKSFASTGLRVGYTYSRRTDIIEHMTNGNYTETAGVSQPSQYAFSKILSHPSTAQWKADFFEEMKRRNEKMASYLIADKKTNSIAAPSDESPDGGFYWFVSSLGMAYYGDPMTRVNDLMENFGVAVVPGTAFGKKNLSTWARLSFSSVSLDHIDSGLNRIFRKHKEKKPDAKVRAAGTV